MNNNNTVYVTPSAGGPLVAFILNILQGYNMTSNAIETEDQQIRTYHRIIESFKYGEAQYAIGANLISWQLFLSPVLNAPQKHFN